MRSFDHFAFSSQVINIVKVECAAFVLLVAFLLQCKKALL